MNHKKCSGDISSIVYKNNGFTIVELVVVTILIAILAVSVAPRFIGNDSFATNIYQTRLISILRTMQYRAMQDTRADYCYQVNIDTATPAFGPPSMDYQGAAVNTCSLTIDSSNPEYLVVSGTELNDDGVSLTAIDGSGNSIQFVGFDSLGRPLVDEDTGTAPVKSCSSACTITLNGSGNTANVCVEPQGYIHAC